jgi:hypothetical protein
VLSRPPPPSPPPQPSSISTSCHAVVIRGDLVPERALGIRALAQPESRALNRQQLLCAAAFALCPLLLFAAVRSPLRWHMEVSNTMRHAHACESVVAGCAVCFALPYRTWPRGRRGLGQLDKRAVDTSYAERRGTPMGAQGTAAHALSSYIQLLSSYIHTIQLPLEHPRDKERGRELSMAI